MILFGIFVAGVILYIRKANKPRPAKQQVNYYFFNNNN